jgi:pyruvate/2-oxoglutarate dehydrogenase complex dihydrolipoamide dehydrogenase (E3) component
VGKLHLAGDDLGFGEFTADADTRELLGAGLLCDDASNLIHLPAYVIWSKVSHEVGRAFKGLEREFDALYVIAFVAAISV